MNVSIAYFYGPIKTGGIRYGHIEHTIHSTKTNKHAQYIVRRQTNIHNTQHEDKQTYTIHYEDKQTYTTHSTKTNKHTQHTVRKQTNIHNTQYEDKHTYTTQHEKLNR